MNKILTLLLIAGLIGMDLVSCSNNRSDYRDDLEINTMQKEIDQLLYHADSLISYDPDDIHFYLDIPEEYCIDCIVRAQTSSTSIDEYGIFHCNNESDAKKLEELIEEYLERALDGKRDWLTSYNPGELEKLEKSRVERYGCYVFYGILDPSTERMAVRKIEELLSQE